MLHPGIAYDIVSGCDEDVLRGTASGYSGLKPAWLG
jgi:hypothetical protein